MRLTMLAWVGVVAACGGTDQTPGIVQLDGVSADDTAAADTDGERDTAAGSDGEDGAAMVDAMPDTGAPGDAAGCSCDGLECGLNACGEACGSCPQAAPHCYDNLCAVDCRPACADRACGDDGCGGDCGDCGPGASCEDGQCVCAPACGEKVCGDDGCGGSCGSCDGGVACFGGQCGCTPACAEHECGDDGCGGSCGSCPQAAPYCVESLCKVSCTPQCAGKTCGADGCGGSCGACGATEACVSGSCASCSCTGLECGMTPCGDSCGSCPGTAPYCVVGACEATAPCPVPVITVAEGTQVSPVTTLHLSGLGSIAADGVSAWAWTVVAPAGASATFKPAATVASPTFETNVTGTYTFGLTLYDAHGTPACAPASVTVYVSPGEGIHVELVWTTPGDLDPTDTGFSDLNVSAGSDVDLHLVHPSAIDPFFSPEGYFNSRYDCYWQNTSPNWGSAGTSDDPVVNRDDTDGAGPESVTLQVPEAGKVYKIGVHYWDDWGYGPSFATLRVFINGELGLEWPNVQLVRDDLWEVASVTWPSGSVVKIEENGSGTNLPLILPDYYFGP